MRTPTIQSYIKKTVPFKLNKHSLVFDTSQQLFSSYTIDHGTQRLLRSIIKTKTPYSKVLDLGCGYGPIGLTLKTLKPHSQIQLIDRDALAIDFVKHNAQKNKITDVDCYTSLGYRWVKDTDFDLIISNVPAKVGEDVLQEWLISSYYYLIPKGKVAIVVIDEINPVVQQLLSNTSIAIDYHHRWPGHHVYIYHFLNQPTIQQSTNLKPYLRNTIAIPFKKHTLEIETSHHLPEFDQPSYATQVLLNHIAKLQYKSHPKQVMIINPNQGIIPNAVATKFTRSQLHIVDRNLLALSTTLHNLKKIQSSTSPSTYCQSHITISQNADFDMIIGILPIKHNTNIYQQTLSEISQQLHHEGTAILASSSTIISRVIPLLNHTNLKCRKRWKNKGQSVIILNHKQAGSHQLI